jgi:NAD(P)-dependent dehydrogenase (short-subunit alcohol dehydrogenase family)
MTNHTSLRLQGKTTIITGAASGFGRATALRFAREGAQVVVADLQIGSGQALVNELTQEGYQALFVHCDVSLEDNVQTLVKATIETFKKLDVVINNAGTTHRNKPALEVTSEEFDRMFSVNVKSLYWMAQAAVPHLKDTKGCMVNVASTTGVRPGPGLAWYSASKAAMINITKGLGLELARDHVRVNAVCPMIGETAMLEQFMGMPDTPENRQRFLARIPLGRFTRPEDVAEAVLYLASDAANFLTGVCIDVDGGRNI